ncbi:MFS transporter [Rahnella sp. SAP-1]|jgi:EmrB/QacA subfamily drug resistance transporter|uniref:MFS transporter n=1 Tax=Rouxiella aceris TaxID=2703884 RepID=A0A848MEN1_9GAMM|nr:MFS transporter [Rouxiella aceris]NMP26738.1 MFS transporter [Rouxiella aceris]
MGQDQQRSSGISAIALLVAAAFFMEFIDGTVIATALPQMAASFGVTPLDLNIGMSAYMLTLAVLIPATGWTAERYGARNVFTLALAIFTLSSLACALTTNVLQFVIMRIFQGVGGAMMVPVGRLTVLKTTPKAQLITAIATLTWPALVAPILGPPLGGFITQYASWHWIFLINIPLGLVAMILAWRLFPQARAAAAQAFDRKGFILSGIAMLCLVSGLSALSQQSIDWVTASLLLIVGIIAGQLMIRHIRRSEHPMFRPDSLRIPTFRIAMGGGSLFRITISAVPFLLPLLLQVGFGMDPFHAGLLVLAVFAGNLAMKPATTPLIRHFGFRPVLVVNGALSVLSLLCCALLTPTTPAWLVLLLLFLGGLSRSMQFTGISTLAFSDVPAPHMADANTLFSTALQLAVGLGVTIGALGTRLGDQIAHWMAWQSIPGIGFKLSFIFMAVITLVGLIDIWRLAANAGESVSGKRA